MTETLPPGMPPQAVIDACRDAARASAGAIAAIMAVDPADRLAVLAQLHAARRFLRDATDALDGALGPLVEWASAKETGENPGHG